MTTMWCHKNVTDNFSHEPPAGPTEPFGTPQCFTRIRAAEIIEVSFHVLTMNPVTSHTAEKLMCALEICMRVHRDDRDRRGMPFVFHSIRVMNRQQTMERKIIALLHDTVESHPESVSLAELESLFGESICASVQALTCQPGEAWDGYIERLLTDEDAAMVKLADLEDNMDPRRMDEKAAKKTYDKYFAAHSRICDTYSIYPYLRV